VALSPFPGDSYTSGPLIPDQAGSRHVTARLKVGNYPVAVAVAR
jgi:hypothetical protein